jgi:Fe-S-cluster containining protein
MSCSSCSGACCAVFEFTDPSEPRFAGNGDEAEFLADMLVSLSLVEAAERLAEIGSLPYWGEEPQHDWDGQSLSRTGRRLMTCRHWDRETRLCTVYDQRPSMCREYPYYASDCDYECGFSLTFKEMWDRALRLNGPEGGTPSNIIRGYN